MGEEEERKALKVCKSPRSLWIERREMGHCRDEVEGDWDGLAVVVEREEREREDEMAD